MDKRELAMKNKEEGGLDSDDERARSKETTLLPKINCKTRK